MIDRKEVYAAIDSERDYQNSLGRDRTSGIRHTVGDSLTLLAAYLRKAQDTWAAHPGDQETLGVIRKVAAIAVHCMEEHGAPKRKLP